MYRKSYTGALIECTVGKRKRRKVFPYKMKKTNQIKEAKREKGNWIICFLFLRNSLEVVESFLIS